MAEWGRRGEAMDATAGYTWRADPAVPAFPDDHPVIVFDAGSALCTEWVQLVLRRDHAARFRLLPAQTPLGRALCRHLGLAPDAVGTNVLLAEGRSWFHSEACIRVARGLGWPWSLAVLTRILPLGLRDRLYARLARRRAGILGRREAGYTPERVYADRFLE